MARIQPARSARLLRRARKTHSKLRAQAIAFFDRRPYRFEASVIESQPNEVVYRARLVRRVPWRLQRLARRALRQLRALAGTEAPSMAECRVLSRVVAYRPRAFRPVLVPGVRAEATLRMSGKPLGGAASIRAPEWDARRREVTLIRHDPKAEFSGKLDIRFHLEFADTSEFAGRSAIALFAAALDEVSDWLNESPPSAEPARRAGVPVAAGRRAGTGAKKQAEW